MKKFVLPAALAAVMSAPATAQAATVWTIELQSDTVAHITMTGTMDEALNGSENLTFLGAAAELGNFGSEAAGGDFSIGGVAANVTFVGGVSLDFEIDFDGLFAAGSSAMGTLIAALDMETWAASGTTGSVTNGGGGSGNVVGTYSIVAPSSVALPAGMPLLLLGLGGLAWVRSKKRKATVVDGAST